MRGNYNKESASGVEAAPDGRYRGSGSFWKRILEESVSGGVGGGWLSGPRDESEDAVPKPCVNSVGNRMELRFEVGERGRRRSLWQAETVEVLSLGSGVKSLWAVETMDELEALSGRVVLPTTREDPVCRLKVEFSRIAGFEEGELWRTRPVTLPREGTANEERKLETELAGARVSVHSLTAPRGVVPGSFRDFWNRWVGDSNAFTLWMEVAPAGGDRRLTLVSAVDEHGRAATVTTGLWSGDHYAFGLIPQAGATSLSFTFALHRSRVVELLVDTRELNREPETQG